MFSKFFESTFEPSQPINPHDISNDESHIDTNISSILFEEDEIATALKQIDINKGAGPDNIEPIFINQT